MTSERESARPCGCDLGAPIPHTCEWHSMRIPDPTVGEIITLLPTDKSVRKETPIATGVLDYFPKAVAEVARVSYVGNEQHNPGEPLHWAREKSTDHADCLVRHLLERGTLDTDGMRHTAKVAWRALALLETELEKGV
jgi:hypothetical protein